jgi:hypothetical protein
VNLSYKINLFLNFVQNSFTEHFSSGITRPICFFVLNCEHFYAYNLRLKIKAKLILHSNEPEKVIYMADTVGQSPSKNIKQNLIEVLL